MTVDWTQAMTRNEVITKKPDPVARTTPHGSWGARSVMVEQAPATPTTEPGFLRLLADAAFVISAVTGSSGMVLGTAAMSHTFGDRSASYADTESAQWAQMNRRRVFLLEKDRAMGLDAAQTEELTRLREQLSRALNARDPLPFDRLSELERRVAEAKTRRDRNG